MENETAAGLTFDDPEVDASFTVDAPRRLISGMIVPWGKVARSGMAKWRFSRGSLHWSQTSRVKLNTDHDHTQAIAKAIDIQNTALGLDATFKVARGEAGDRALALAEDGVLDGFSIEVDFDEGDGWAPDPETENVRLVDKGRLVGVALTGFPAFDDARVERVAAARRQGGDMEEKVKEQEPVAMTADQGAVVFESAMQGMAQKITDSQVKLTESLTQSIGESISEGVKTALEGISGPQERGTVRAARYSVTREAPIYAFDGTGECLVRDAWAAARDKDDDAIDRLRKYRKQSEEMAKLAKDYVLGFTPQTTSTAAQVIPPGYRPDLYIPDFTKGRPLVSLASHGTIANATPFTVPIFGSATSVSADHVEGTNPSDGSLAFTTKTVTPQAISGRLTLSREIVDSSNPAIDQIALAEMRESYARQTEVKVYTLLNGTSGAGGTITGDTVPSGAQASTIAKGTDNQALAAHLRERLAKYPFMRFADPDGGAMGMAASVLIATALDTTKRPLFPTVQPMNAFGTKNQRAWDVDGVRFAPAWSNTGTAAGDSQIMILNSSDLWVWESPLLTFRFEEKQGPANIELNVFGYFGVHLLRPVGLSGIRIT
jgi:HK97 family phage prohead protease